jgi:hypothetical protein
MEELKSYLETVIALTTKHIADDEAWKTDAINGRFYAGRLVVEKSDLEVFKKLADMVNKL